MASLVPLLFGPDEPSATEPSAAMTMAFVVMALGTVLTGLATRRDPESGLSPPGAKALGILSAPVLLTVVTTTWEPLQTLLQTQVLTGQQWIQAFGLALIVLVVVETEKWTRRRRSARS